MSDVIDYTKFTDEDLLKEYERLWSNNMYYQAAEGNWSSERDAREANAQKYYACQKVALDRGLKLV